MNDARHPDHPTTESGSTLQPEQRLRLLDEAVGVTREGIVISDSTQPDEPIIYVNEGFEQITGYPREEVLGRNCRFLQGPETNPDQTDRIREALVTGSPVQVELLNYRRDGSAFWNLVSITPLRSRDGSVTHRIGVQLDVTDRHNAEEALQQARDELEQRVEQRTAELRRAVESLENEVRERRQAEAALLDQRERLRTLASELSRAEEQERRRIAADLHDRLSQGLVGLKVKLEMLRTLPVSEQTDRQFDGVLELIDELVGETRSMTFELCPPMLYDLGLAAAIEELARRIEADGDLRVEVIDDGRDKSPDAELRGFLYRAARELMINVVKHAGARRMAVSLARGDRTISVSVEDDGTGMDTDAEPIGAAGRPGFGLFHIRQRLDYFGGWMLEESRRGEGTTMTMIVPLDPAKPRKGKP